LKEMMSRYPKVCFEDRMAILTAFLRGAKKEVEWVARRLRDTWIRSLEKEVGDCWSRTHNVLIAKVVLRHMPTEYVIAEQEALSEACSYREVCGRICNEKGAVIDYGRLSVPDRLYVLAKMQDRKEEDVDAMLDNYLSEGSYLDEKTNGTILWSLGKLGKTGTILRVLPELELHQQIADLVDDIIHQF